MLLYLIYLLLLSPAFKAYLFIELRNPNATKGECYTITHDIGIFSYDETRMVFETCEVAVCQHGGSTLFLGCGKVGLGTNCTIIEPQPFMLYPYCCNREVKCN